MKTNPQKTQDTPIDVPSVVEPIPQPAAALRPNSGVEVREVDGELVPVPVWEGLVSRVADLATAANAMAVSYVSVVSWIKQNQIAPKVVRSAMSASFPAPRISEFIRVAALPAPEFQKYESGKIGFRAALATARAPKTDVDPVKKALQTLLRSAHAFTNAAQKNLVAIEDTDLVIVVPWFEKNAFKDSNTFTLKGKGLKIEITKTK